jgi:tetratricopeptide (TPR) repeat protein
MQRTPPPGVSQLLTAAVQRFQAGNLREAEHLLRRVLALDPRRAVALHLLGVVAAQAGHAADAVELIGMAIASNPRDATAHSSLGNVLQQQGRLDAAIASYRRAIALQPAFPEALNNLANALKAQKKLPEAIGFYRRALAAAPDNAETHYNLAMALLAQGELPAGWQEHEWRWATRQFSGGHRHFAQPQWRGEAAEGRSLLVHAEQGFGDTLQFCRYVPLAAARGLRVILQVPKPLSRLLRDLAGVDRHPPIAPCASTYSA